MQWESGAQAALCNSLKHREVPALPVCLRCQTFPPALQVTGERPPSHGRMLLKCGICFLVEKQSCESCNALSADYWSESDQDDMDGSLTLKQEGSSTLCDTYHRTPSVSHTPAWDPRPPQTAGDLHLHLSGPWIFKHHKE